MAADYYRAGLARVAAVAAVVTITLNGIGTAFNIIGNTKGGQKGGGSGSVLQIWRSSGAQVGKLNSSGSLILSGSLIVNHRGTGSGKMVILGTVGTGICGKGKDGNCYCIDFQTAGAMRAGQAKECTPGDAQ